MSESKQALLSELSIDRGGAAAAASGRGGVPVWLTLLLVLVAGGGGAAVVAWLTQDAAPVAVRLAEVRRVSAGGEGAATVAESRERTVLDATGYITARRQATVSSEVTGRVIEVLIEEGMVVEQGQLLARLDDSLLAAGVALAEAQLEASRASLDETLAQLREAERSLERVRDLQGRDLASEQELDAAIAAQETFSARLARQRQDIMVAERALDVQRRQLEDFTIVAPFAGVVIDKAAQPGEMISPVSAGGGFTRTGICTIVDMESLEVEVDVNESYINRVRDGQPVVATLNSYPEWQIPAEVITIIPAADRNRATVRVRIRLLVRDARILPDMGVKVAFLAAAPMTTAATGGGGAESERIAGLYVAADAVYVRGNEAVAYVPAGLGAEARVISVGETRAGERRVLAGLSEGDSVIRGLTDELARSLDKGATILVR